MVIANALAAAIRKIGPFDLIMSGRQSADLDQGIVATGVAMLLGVPVMTNASRVEMNGDAVQIDRLVDDGVDTIEAQLPALVTVSSEIGQPRYATMRGIMAARKVDATVWSGADLDSLESSEALTTLVDLFEPEKSSNVELIEGENPADSGRLLAQRLRAERLL